MKRNLAITKHRRTSAGRGFSLIELVVVIAIVGVMSAMALPTVQARIQKQKEDAALEDVKAALTAFRNIARTKVVCVGVKIVGNTLEASPHIDCATPASALPKEVRTFDSKKVKLLSFSAVGLVGDPVFQKKGGLKLDGPLSLKVKTLSDGVTHTFHAYPATGMVKRQ